jgi:mono/diheme cytochrome c family protein
MRAAVPGDEATMNLAPRAALGALIAPLVLGLAAFCAPAAAADAERGRMLHETRCGECHVDSVYNRKARKARSFEALRVQVRRWSAEAGGAWSDDEIDDLTLYLNARFYHFPCPPGVCRAHQASIAR